MSRALSPVLPAEGVDEERSLAALVEAAPGAGGVAVAPGPAGRGAGARCGPPRRGRGGLDGGLLPLLRGAGARLSLDPDGGFDRLPVGALAGQDGGPFQDLARLRCVP